MAKTQIKLLRGAGQYNSIAMATANAGALSACEPWVNTTSKQLWVDAVCVNPHLTVAANNANYLTLEYSQVDETGEVLSTLTFDAAGYQSHIFSEGKDFIVKYGSNGTSEDVVYDFDGQNDGFIVIGSGLSYDATTNTISADLIESFLSGVEVVAGSAIPEADRPSGWSANKTYMHFTFTTNGTPAASEIYVDVTSFYDDTDTQTQLSGTAGDDVVVTLTSNSGVFQTNGTNTYSIVHKTITTTPATSTASPAYGGTFTAIDSLTIVNGHVTGYNTKTVTLPSSDDTTYDFAADVDGTAVDGRKPEAKLTLTGSDSSTDTVTIKHEAQTSGVGSMVMFKESSENVIEMQVTVIDGGTF